MSLNPKSSRRRDRSKSKSGRRESSRIRAPSPTQGYAPPRSPRYEEHSSSRYREDHGYSSRRSPRDSRGRDETAYTSAPYPTASPPYAMPGAFGKEDQRPSRYDEVADPIPTRRHGNRPRYAEPAYERELERESNPLSRYAPSDAQYQVPYAGDVSSDPRDLNATRNVDRGLDIKFEYGHLGEALTGHDKHRRRASSGYARISANTGPSPGTKSKKWEFSSPDDLAYTSNGNEYAALPARPYAIPGSYTPVAAEASRYRASPGLGASSGMNLGVDASIGMGAEASLTNAPGSPMLEPYRGTYQSIGTMPSPLAVASRPYKYDNEDVEVLEIAPTPASRHRHARFHDMENDASILRKTLREPKRKSLPDPEPLIDILPPLTHEQIMMLRVEYKKQVKTPDMKGVNIAKHIKVRLKEDKSFLKACYATALGRWESEAYWANSYYQGSQTSRELLIESLMGRTNDEIRLIKVAFRDKKYSDDLTKCMWQELKSDKFKNAVMLVLEEKRMEDRPGYLLDRHLIERDVRDLYRAVKSDRGGETAMIQIVIPRSDSHLREILRVYEASYHSNFARDMLKKSGNLVGEMLAHILNGVINRPVRDALLLHHALSLTKSDKLRVDLLVSRLVRYHWDRPHMEAVKREFRHRYGEQLQDAVRHGTKGNWGDFCEELCVTRTSDDVKRYEKVERIGR